MDIENHAELLSYLRRRGRVEVSDEVAVRVLTGGVSNRTVRVAFASGEAWVLKQALSKLRVAADWFSSPERIYREAAGLRWLERIAPAGSTTPLVFEDELEHVLAMKAVPDPHQNWKEMLLAGDLRSEHVEQFAALLATVHRVASELNERTGDIEHAFADRTFFESLRLEPYYLYAAGRVPATGAFLEELVKHTRGRAFTLVHGDFSPKNVLVHQHKLVLIDHEVVHFGDPAFDVGFALTHLLSKAHHLCAYRDAFRRAALQFWDAYRSTLGDVRWSAGLEGYAVRHTLAILLARVAGRSPLEYLNASERTAQQAVTSKLMACPPTNIPEFIEAFLVGVAAEGEHRVDHR